MASEYHTNATLAALQTYKESPFVKHQWEEIEDYVYGSNDPKLLEMFTKKTHGSREENLILKLR